MKNLYIFMFLNYINKNMSYNLTNLSLEPFAAQQIQSGGASRKVVKLALFIIMALFILVNLYLTISLLTNGSLGSVSTMWFYLIATAFILYFLSMFELMNSYSHVAQGKAEYFISLFIMMMSGIGLYVFYNKESTNTDKLTFGFAAGTFSMSSLLAIVLGIMIMMKDPDEEYETTDE